MLRRVWAEANSNQWSFMMKPKSTQHVDRDYFDQYGQRRFCNLSMSVAARRPAVQIFHPTARCSCGRRMLWMCPRHIFHRIYFPYLMPFICRHPQVSKAFGSTSQHVGAVRTQNLFSAVAYRPLQHSRSQLTL